MRYSFTRCLVFIMLYTTGLVSAQAAPNNILTVEEQRYVSNPELTLYTDVFNQRIETFKNQLTNPVSYTVLTQLVIRHGKGIWQDAIEHFQINQSLDDRHLYWTRLAMFSVLKSAISYQTLLPMQKEKLLFQFELLSRGDSHVKFKQNSNKRILVLATDPFQNQESIDVINSAAISALALNGMTLNLNGQKAELKSLILPVNYDYLDKGIVEEVLNDVISRKTVDLVLILGENSQGFKLSQFATIKSTTISSDNVMKARGDNLTSAMPLLKNKSLNNTPKLATTWLHHRAMKINSRYLEKEQLQPTQPHINEVFYRALNVNQREGRSVFVGQLDVPALSKHDNSQLKLIFNQLRQLLTVSINDI